MDAFKKFLKLSAIALSTIVILAGCAEKTKNNVMSDNKNIFGVPVGTWDKLSPDQQRQVIKKYASRKRWQSKANNPMHEPMISNREPEITNKPVQSLKPNYKISRNNAKNNHGYVDLNSSM